jgi:hypothetical protein
MDKWQALLAELKVTGDSQSCCQEEDIIQLESVTGIILPAGYKEFCLVFGSGVLSGFIDILCPCQIKNRADVRRIQWNIEALREEITYEREMGDCDPAKLNEECA